MSSREAFEGADIDEDRAGMNGLVDRDGFKQDKEMYSASWIKILKLDLILFINLKMCLN